MDSTEKDDNPILFFWGEILIIFMKGGTPTSPFAENATKTINFFQPFPNSDELNTPKIYYLLFPEIVNIPHILDILDILLRLVYLTSLALLIFFVLVFHKILSYNGYNGKSDLSCNSQFSCYP